MVALSQKRRVDKARRYLARRKHSVKTLPGGVAVNFAGGEYTVHTKLDGTQIAVGKIAVTTFLHHEVPAAAAKPILAAAAQARVAQTLDAALDTLVELETQAETRIRALAAQ
jgi:hypothetical protein